MARSRTAAQRSVANANPKLWRKFYVDHFSPALVQLEAKYIHCEPPPWEALGEHHALHSGADHALGIGDWFGTVVMNDTQRAARDEHRAAISRWKELTGDVVEIPMRNCVFRVYVTPEDLAAHAPLLHTDRHKDIVVASRKASLHFPTHQNIRYDAASDAYAGAMRMFSDTEIPYNWRIMREFDVVAHGEERTRVEAIVAHALRMANRRMEVLLVRYFFAVLAYSDATTRAVVEAMPYLHDLCHTLGIRVALNESNVPMRGGDNTVNDAIGFHGAQAVTSIAPMISAAFVPMVAASHGARWRGRSGKVHPYYEFIVAGCTEIYPATPTWLASMCHGAGVQPDANGDYPLYGLGAKLNELPFGATSHKAEIDLG